MKIRSLLLFLCCFFISACVTITPVPDQASGEPSENEAENAASDQGFVPGSLPVIYLNIDGGQEEIDQMNASPEHTYRCTGTMDLFIPEGYRSPYEDGPFESLEGLQMEYIRGRGNSSWGQEKKPYKIRLDKGTVLHA